MKSFSLLLRFFFIVVSAYASMANAAEFNVTQKDQKFSVEKLTVKVGDTVNFKNEDPFSHNIFSLSDIAVFDLGSYPKGQSRAHTFTKPGKGVIECAVHSDMRMEIEVLP